MTTEALQRRGPPLSKRQILVREIRAIERQIREGKAGAAALARRKEKLRHRLNSLSDVQQSSKSHRRHVDECTH
jgi:hypothetical protein